MANISQQDTWDIRPLRPDEVDVVADVLGLARLYQRHGCYLVAWAAGGPLGHVHIAFTEPPELQDLEVRTTYRRLGVATALITAAEEEAHARGFHEVRLEVSMAAAAARALYRRCGYLDAGLPIHRVKGRVILRTGPIDIDDNLLVMTKRLDT